MTKKVLISLDDIIKILKCDGKTFYDGYRDPDLQHLKNFKAWFDAQPDAPIYRSGSFKITPEQLDKFMQSDNLVLDGTRCKTCGQLGRIKEGVLSKMEATGE